MAFSHLKTSSGEASGERQRGQETAALVPQVTSAQVSAEVAVLPPERGDGAGRGPREAATPPGRRGRGGRRLLSRWPCLPLLCRRQAVDLRHHLRDLILQPLSEKKDRRGGGASASLLRLRAEPLLRSCLGPQGGDAGACHWPSQSRPAPEPAGLCSAASQRSPGVHWAGPGCPRARPTGTPGTPARCKGTKAQEQSVPVRSRRPCARLPPASGRCVPGTTRATGDVNAFRTGSPRPDHDRQRPRGRGDRRATRGPLHGRGEQEVRRPLPSALPCLTQSRVPLPADAGATLPGRRGLCFTDLDTSRSRSVPPRGSVRGRQTLIFYVCTKPPDLLFYLKANTERFSYLDVINKFLFSSTNV